MLRTSAASPARTDDRSIPAATHTPFLFERLRAETAGSHRDLESRIDLVSTSLDVPRYVQLLRNFRRANAAYESVAGPVLPDALRPMFEARRKTALIDADLRHFDATEPDHPDERADMARIVAGDPHAAVGAMYVFEGSTLGGAVVARHLERQLGLRGLQGCSYFTPYAGNTGSMWREFKQQVYAVIGDDRDAGDAIVAAAGATFVWLARALPRTH